MKITVDIWPLLSRQVDSFVHQIIQNFLFELVVKVNAIETWSLEPEYHGRKSISHNFCHAPYPLKCHRQHFQKLCTAFAPFEFFLS